MKEISESDYRLLVHDLPVLLRAINIHGSDIRLMNIARRLVLLSRKLKRKETKNKL